MMEMHGEDAVIPDHLSDIIVYLYSCFCDETCAEHHIISASIVIKEKCTLFCNAAILIKLWEVHVMQGNHHESVQRH